MVNLSQLAIGQTKLQGTFIRTDTVGHLINETITVKNDSIWFSRKRIGENISRGEIFENWSGKVRSYRKGHNDKPFYSAILYVMSCDSCPEFWEYTTKRKDSMNIETHFWKMGETEIVVENGDTSYFTPELVMVDDPTDLDRMRVLFFTISKSGDIIKGKEVYIRQRKINL